MASLPDADGPAYESARLAEAIRTGERARELLKAPGAHVTKQHTVSKGIVRQFAEKSAHGSRVGVYSVRFGRRKPLGPAGAGMTRDFLRVDSANAEKVWKTVEDRLPDAIAAARSPKIHEQPTHLNVLRDAIALHFARSLATAQTMAAIWQQMDATHPDVLLARYPSECAEDYYRKHKLWPGTRAILREHVKRLMDEIAAPITSGAWARVRMEELFYKVRHRAAAWPIEVIRPAEGEFLIGDVPALTATAAGPRPNGRRVPLDEASQVVMPLSPDVLIAVGPNGGYGVADPATVEALNSWQVVCAVEHVYYRSTADFVNFIEKVRPRVPPTP